MNNNTAKTLGSTCFCNVLYRDTVKLSNLMRTISKRTENEEKNSPKKFRIYKSFGRFLNFF
jgi:hypothetical protein